jgi:ribonuclease HI
VFAWKAATNTLAVMENVHRRLITVPATCTVCGAASEDAHHALVLCTPARALRDQLRQVWALPPERDFIRTGEEWFLQLLANVPAETKPLLLFLFWRVWHHRNNIVHGDGKAPISASVPFLQNYAETFKLAASKQTDSKGKEKLFRMDLVVSDFSSTKSDWRPPNAGCTKVNVDGGWDWASKNAGWGMIVRDCTCNVKLSVWHHLTGCASAEQSEAIACLEGLKKIIHMRCWPAIIETDCIRVVAAIALESVDRSSLWCIYWEIQELLRFQPDIRIQKVDRESNKVAHVLAQLGKSGFSGSLHDSAPACALELITNDCKG